MACPYLPLGGQAAIRQHNKFYLCNRYNKKTSLGLLAIPGFQTVVREQSRSLFLLLLSSFFSAPFNVTLLTTKQSKAKIFLQCQSLKRHIFCACFLKINIEFTTSHYKRINERQNAATHRVLLTLSTPPYWLPPPKFKQQSKLTFANVSKAIFSSLWTITNRFMAVSTSLYSACWTCTLASLDSCTESKCFSAAYSKNVAQRSETVAYVCL